MNVFLDDLVNGLFHQVQDKMELLLEDDDDDVVVEKEHKWNTTTTTTTSTKPPKSTDLLYLTDRLLLSSAPRLANPPQYHDRGRDERRRRRRRRPTTTTTATTTTSQPITPPQGKDDDDHDDDHDDDDNAKEPPPPAAAAAAAAVAATDDDSNVATTEPNPETPTNPSSMEATAAAAEEEDPNYQATVEKTTTTTTNHHHTNHPPPPIIKRRRRMMMMIPDNQISPSQHPRQNNNETPSAVPPTTTTTTPQGGDHHPKDSSSSSNTTTMIDATTTSLDDDPASSIIMMGDDDDNHNHNHNHLSIPGVVATDPSPTTTTTTLSTLSQDNNDDRQPPPQQPVMMDDHDDDEHDDHDDDEHDDSSPAAALCDPPPPSVPQHHYPEEDAPPTTAPTTTIHNSPATMVTSPPPPSVPQHHHPEEDAPPTTAPTTTIHNSPATMVTYLEQRHGKNHFLAFSFMDTPPDDRTLLLFRRQLVHLGWWSPCPERSETPSIPKLLEACYAMHAYLQLDPSNVAWVYCANGKSRTAIVLACYLKFAGFVSHSCQGFCHFLIKTFQLGDDNAHKSRSRRSRRRRPNHPPPSKDEKKAATTTTTTTTTMIWNQLPPSLRLFFRQFDTVVDMGGYPNNQHPKQPSSSLLLRAIALQGIPVEDKPCLDLWDSSQRHVYSSHPEMWKKKNHHPHHNNNNNNKPTTKPSSQWADEEGFYKVNVVLEGDFLLLCRFGGDFAQEATTIHDPTKILFRYANTTGFLSGGCPYELPPQKVDLSRRYASHLDDEDFLVTLLFEADWERMDDDDDDDDVEQRAQASSSRVSSSHKQVWRSHEQQACEEGWNIIFQHHSARPDKSDIRDFQRFCHNKNLGSCSDHLVCLALQLTNFEYKQAERLLLDSPSFAWWQQGVVGDENNGADTNKISSTEETKDFDQRNGNQEKEFDCHQDRATREISDILDEIDVSSNLELPDVVQMENFETSASSYRARLENMATPKRRGGSGQFPRKQQHPHAFADPCLRDYGWMVPSMMYPRRGDILGLFGPNYQQFHSMLPSRNNVETPPSITSRTRPRMPFVARDRPKMFLPGAKRQRQDSTDDCMPFPVPPYDPRREAALQLFLGVRHTGVTLPGLIDLVESSQQWSGVPMVDEEDSTSIKESGAIEMEKPTIQASGSRDASMNRDAKEQQQKKWDEARKAEEKDKEDKKKAEDAKKKDEEEKAATESKGEDPNTKANSGEVPLKDDPDFAKYFKMLKMGMAKEQVLHAMKRDDKDPIILDLDPNKSMKAQLPKESKTTDGGVPLKDDPEYVKYFKMLKMGLPVGAVKNALQKDGKDPSIMDLDPNKSLKSQKKESENDDDGPALQDDPEYQKYFKMLNMGLPLGAVKNAITKDGKDPSIMDLDPKKSAKSQMGGNATATDNGPPLKEDPEYVKYFKMLSMGLPMGAVKNALSRDGKDPAIMDLDPNTSIKSQLGGQAEEKDTGIPLKDDPEYTKYFKMLIMGLPKGAVKNALERDGKNPAIMDLDPNKSVAFQLKKPVSANKKPAKKKRVRRKKIYWNPIDPLKLKADSMWNIVRGSVIMGKLNYDVKEFEDLFTEDPAADKKKKKGNTNKAAKKLVQVIDGKRDMNGGIILARLKTDYSKIARIVTKMEHGKFNETQLKALKEYLPDADERRGLIAFMKKGESSQEVKDKLYSELSETEKYMVTIMEVSDAAAKFDAMFYRSSFKNRFEDITASIRTLNSACDELRSSEKLRKLMAMILTVVNEINTGGEGNMEMGFTLDALLKLNEAKAFDKKTSVLHYVVKLVKKNDEDLLNFSTGLASVTAAESVLLDSLSNDVKAVGTELSGVYETVKVEADRLEEAGELKPITLADLAEQKTAVRQVGFVPHYNKMEHFTGRTSMERFALNARISCEQATESINDVKKKYKALLGYFGEDEQMATGDFFGTLRRFMLEWKKAVEQVEAIEKKQAKEKKRAAVKAAKEAKKGAKTKTDRGFGEAKSGRSGIAGLAAAAASRKNKVGNVGVEPKSTGTTIGGIAAMAASAASRKKDGGDSQKTGDPDQTPASQIQQGSYKRAIYDDKEEPVNLQADKSNVQEFDSKSDFSMKAAAYRKWKDQEEEGQPVAKVISKILDERPNSDTLRSEKASPDDKKSDFLSSVKAYRKKKSNRNLQVDEGGAEVEPVTTLLDKKYIQGTPGTVSVEDKPFRNQIGLSDAHHTLELEKTGIRGAVTMNLSEDLIKAETGIVVGGNAKSVEKARLNITDRENEAVVELPSVKSNENESGPLTEKNAQKPETANVGAAFPMNEAMEPIQAEADAKTEWTTSTTEAPTTDLDKELEQSTESPGISSSLELPSREQVDATSVPETRKAREEKKGFAGENPVLTSAPVRLESKQTLKVTLDTPRRDVGESGLLIAQTETPAEKGKIFSLSSFLEQPSPENLRSEVLRQNYDESSVAIIAENLQNRPIESHMSETWTQGDTIPNWMGWANQVIRTSDTESVQGFEMSRDLSGLNDFDDDSTIATNYTNYDDTSVVSAMTPARETYVSFDNAYHDHDSSLFSPLGETSFLTVDKADAMAAITPAKVAASILFSDSPSSSIDRTQSNVNSGHDQDLIGTGLSFSADNIGVDAGLSFGADVGFDDGLGFGNDFGNEEWIGAASESQTARDDKNPEKRAKWFPWGNNK